MDKIILLNYSNKNLPFAFGGVQAIYDYYKPHVSRSEVKRILQGIPAYTSRAQQRKVKIFAPTFAFFPRQLFQLDLIDISYISSQNRGVKYLFSIIDCATRFAFVIELKNKSGKYVADKFRKFLASLKKKPIRVHSDR